MAGDPKALKLTSLADDARIALSNLAEAAVSVVTPSVRIGVTGLSRAGKTIFITALVHNLVRGGRLPLFSAHAEKRIARAFLEPQPDDGVPRFDYEAHLKDLVDKRIWPDSTRRISELRLTIEYESAGFLSRALGRGRLHVDLVDYPGEWLLDLPLLAQDYADWSRHAVELAREPKRAQLAAEWLGFLATLDPAGPDDEETARKAAALFTDYLRACRADAFALSTLSPGRFLMPGDLEGSPALTFSPLILPEDGGAVPRGSLRAMMERRYEAYKSIVVRPFFRDHFTRLDRQIVLVDALAALNAGPEALHDLEAALGEILACFRPGRNSWLSTLVTRRIDRLLFAATKADHLHHEDHDRLEAVLRRLVAGGIERAEFAGAEVDVLALASVRATREARVKHEGEELACIMGTPLPGERADGQVFDGETEIAMFPGDLPRDPEKLFEVKNRTLDPSEDRLASQGKHAQNPPVAVVDEDNPLRFVRFRPPRVEKTAGGRELSLPHIRLDRAIEFLIGDRLA
ncbi:MAG TPA: YcjX family protein [Kaistiaceae bacterium]|nr:YcjX family protein [Kaistiaceae bacterium]